MLFSLTTQQIQYAKGKSDAVAKIDGTYLPKHLRNQRPTPGLLIDPTQQTEEDRKRKAEEEGMLRFISKLTLISSRSTRSSKTKSSTNSYRSS